MSLKLYIFPLVTLYLVFQLQQINATFLVESATGKALIQSACSASDSPPACYAVLNPVANNPNLNPNDICTVAIQAASKSVQATYDMLNMSLTVTVQVAKDPAVRQSLVLCAKEYAQVLAMVDKCATALSTKVDEVNVPQYLSTAIASVAKCDASAIKVANTVVQLTHKNVDCSKLLRNALGIYKVFAESIENSSHDAAQGAGSASGKASGSASGSAGGSASGSAGGKHKSEVSGTSQSSNDNNGQFSFSKQGQFNNDFSARVQGAYHTADGVNTPSQISTSSKFALSDLAHPFKSLSSDGEAAPAGTAAQPDITSGEGEPDSASAAAPNPSISAGGMKFGLADLMHPFKAASNDPGADTESTAAGAPDSSDVSEPSPSVTGGGMKLSFSDLNPFKSFSSKKKDDESSSPSPAPSSSDDDENATSPSGSDDDQVDGPSSDDDSAGAPDGLNSYNDDDATDGPSSDDGDDGGSSNDAEGPSVDSDDEVSMKFSFSHLIPNA